MINSMFETTSNFGRYIRTKQSNLILGTSISRGQTSTTHGIKPKNLSYKTNRINKFSPKGTTQLQHRISMVSRVEGMYIYHQTNKWRHNLFCLRALPWLVPSHLLDWSRGIMRIWSSELYKDWNDTSIRPAVSLSEAKLMAAGGSHVWQKHASVVVLYR